MIGELVLANRILYNHRVVDAFGHVSMRDVNRPDRFLLSRSMAPTLVTEKDIVEFDLDGNPVESTDAPLYLERHIHTEIYRAQTEVQAVVHSHSAALIPFGVVASHPLRAVSHMGSFLGEGVPVFEIRDEAGQGSDLLIRDRGLGAALAKKLSTSPAVLMRGHGATIVGDSLKQAVFRAIYMQANAEMQMQSHSLGSINFLTAEEAVAATSANNGQIERAWDLWTRQVK